MTMAIVLGLFSMPICACLAGVVLWGISRNQALDDKTLFRYFVTLLMSAMVLVWGLSRTDTARKALNPSFRVQTELDMQPVYTVIKQFAPDDFKQLDALLKQHMAQGMSLGDAMIQARPLLTQLANQRLGFADQKSRVLWGRVTADSLRELQTTDPALCYLALAPASLTQAAPSQSFSAENTARFQQAIVSIYRSADLSMRHEQSPDDEPAVEFNAAALEFRAIQAVIEQRFGPAVANQLAKRTFPEPPAGPKETLCAARIVQLDAMLGRPQAMAAMLIDSALR